MRDLQRVGRYEVLNHLASGGMGQVYLARATGLGGFERHVVVKTLELTNSTDDAAFVTMFLDEARLVGGLHHHYIAPIYEVGRAGDFRYYLVMDYVHGETLEALFAASVEHSLMLPRAFSFTVVSCVASALAYAHALCSASGEPLGIVHRDVSLSNVMVGYDGGIKLIDFGIAKARNRATRTRAGALKGKMGYLAPEMILNKQVDHRADIFALGIVLYELTTSTRAFRDRSDLVTLERIANGVLAPPSKVVAGYPAELEAIVMKALAIDPARRYQDAGTLGRELEAFAARRGLVLGHAPVVELMKRMFGERQPRFARASDRIATRETTAVFDDEETPVSDADVGMVGEHNAGGDSGATTNPIVVRQESATDIVPPLSQVERVSLGEQSDRHEPDADELARSNDSGPVTHPDWPIAVSLDGATTLMTPPKLPSDRAPTTKLKPTAPLNGALTAPVLAKANASEPPSPLLRRAIPRPTPASPPSTLQMLPPPPPSLIPPVGLLLTSHPKVRSAEHVLVKRKRHAAIRKWLIRIAVLALLGLALAILVASV